MNEDTTKTLTDGESFEVRVLSELSAIRGEQTEMRREQAEMRAEQAEMRNEIAAIGSRVNSVDERLTSVEVRLSSLEEKVDARLRETRPIWESVLDNIKRLDLKFDEVLRELFDIRADVRRHERLILQLENLR